MSLPRHLRLKVWRTVWHWKCLVNNASRLDRDVMGGEATVARRHIRVKARRGPACLLMAIFQGDLYVGGCREHSGPFLVWHEAFSWTLDQLAARPEWQPPPPGRGT